MRCLGCLPRLVTSSRKSSLTVYTSQSYAKEESANDIMYVV
jgi:hypothetical protein